MNIEIDYSQQIKKFRKLYGFTQEQLAKNSGLSVMSIQRYERGERIPPARAIRALAEVFHLSTSEFMGIPRWEARLNDTENRIVGIYRVLEDNDRKKLFDYAELLCHQPQYENALCAKPEAGDSNAETRKR